ncbi:hypothetical protein [Jannaschia sp. LMIT008]|uniref:hypothetical protein n=1 Tax=Jannaschia maritima TaxID=3032585 RepID=UPI0028111372|nr:hypothetical protein [Jannaschia sp. LMIT008]
MESEIWAQLLGPNGGAMAVCFAAGCIATYGFCQKTMLRESKLRIGELKGEITTLREQIKQLETEFRVEIRARVEAAKAA